MSECKLIRQPRQRMSEMSVDNPLIDRIYYNLSINERNDFGSIELQENKVHFYLIFSYSRFFLSKTVFDGTHGIYVPVNLSSRTQALYGFCISILYFIIFHSIEINPCGRESGVPWSLKRCQLSQQPQWCFGIAFP